MRSIYNLLSLSVLMLAFGCKKDMPAKNLPPVTREGKNTAGFLLDGEVWVPFAKCGLFQDPCKEISVQYNPPYNYYLSIQLERQTSEENSSTITLTSSSRIKEPGEYYDSLSVSLFSERKDPQTGHRLEFGDRSPDGKFIITRLDTLNQIIAGTFNFTLCNREGETVDITEGRFDFKMDACICR